MSSPAYPDALQLTASTVSVAVGALGAIVMPYNIFFQSFVVNGRPRDANTDEKKSVLLKVSQEVCCYMHL
jgi:Mn2+/Fe2+ NRAMP family transporter